jgi:hypothetical protein
MGPQDHLRALPDGIRCTVCDERVPADHLRVLARRDDLLFLEVGCHVCGSTALGFITDSAFRPETDQLAGAEPISGDDVLEMHQLLGSWSGDLVSLVGQAGARPDGRDRPESGRTGRPA